MSMGFLALQTSCYSGTFRFITVISIRNVVGCEGEGGEAEVRASKVMSITGVMLRGDARNVSEVLSVLKTILCKACNNTQLASLSTFS